MLYQWSTCSASDGLSEWERERSTMCAFYEMAWSRFGALKPAWLQGHKHIKSSVSVIQSSRISNAFKLFTKPSPCSVKPDSIRVNTSLLKTERDTEKNWELYEWQTEDCSYRTPSHTCLSLIHALVSASDMHCFLSVWIGDIILTTMAWDIVTGLKKVWV